MLLSINTYIYTYTLLIGLSVRKDELDNWKHPAPPTDCVYCPLCIASVEDSDDAWLKHLSQVCPKNKRILGDKGQEKGQSRPGSSANRPKSGAGGGADAGVGDVRPGTGSNRPGTGSERPGTGSNRPGTGSERPGTGSNRPGTGSNRPSSTSESKVADEEDVYDAKFDD